MSVPFYLGRFFAPPLLPRAFNMYVYAGARRVNGRGRGEAEGQKNRNGCGIVLVCGHCSGRLRGAPRLSFDVKHVRHEEYVNNANKTLFIARVRARPTARPPRRRAYFIIVFFTQFIYPIYFAIFLRVKARCSLGFVAPGPDIIPRLSRRDQICDSSADIC